jgi:hypothetical protein
VPWGGVIHPHRIDSGQFRTLSEDDEDDHSEGDHP